MKDEKVINRTRTLSIWDENGRHILIKITLEMVDQITKEPIPLPKETPDLRGAITRAAYEAAIAFGEEHFPEEQRNDD